MVMEYERILIAVNSSQASKMVFKKGIELAKILKSEVALIGVVDTTTVTNFSPGIDESDALLTGAQLELLKENEKMLKEFMNDLASSERDVTINKEIKYGVPHREIGTYAKEWKADLLVVGSHDKDGSLSEFLFGSTAKKLLKEAPCDVLIVKTEGGKKK